MAHALAEFIRTQMDDRGLRNRDIVSASGLSRALVSRYATDERDVLTRLPEKTTVEGFAKAFNVSPDFLLGKAIESLGLGYSSGDFVNSVATATDDELVRQIQRRLAVRRADDAGDDLTRRRVARVQDGQVAARDIGERSPGQVARDQADQAGEPPADDPDDMDPR